MTDKNPVLKSVYSTSRGFTIVELAAVLFLLFLFVIPLAYSIDRSLRTSNEVYRLTTCALLAQMKVEEVRAKGTCYTTIPATNCPGVADNVGLLENYNEAAPACTFPTPFTQFKCAVVYQNRIGASPMPNWFREIQVRVWFDENYNDTWDAAETDVLYQTGLSYRSLAWLSW